MVHIAPHDPVTQVCGLSPFPSLPRPCDLLKLRAAANLSFFQPHLKDEAEKEPSLLPSLHIRADPKKEKQKNAKTV